MVGEYRSLRCSSVGILADYFTVYAMLSLRDILSGKVKWVRRVGWCDQPFVSIHLLPVERPTVQQIRFVQSISSYSNQNVLKIRELIQRGGESGFGILLPDEAERLGVRLREMGFSYSLQKERVYRPRKWWRGSLG